MIIQNATAARMSRNQAKVPAEARANEKTVWSLNNWNPSQHKAVYHGGGIWVGPFLGGGGQANITAYVCFQNSNYSKWHPLRHLKVHMCITWGMFGMVGDYYPVHGQAVGTTIKD